MSSNSSSTLISGTPDFHRQQDQSAEKSVGSFQPSRSARNFREALEMNRSLKQESADASEPIQQQVGLVPNASVATTYDPQLQAYTTMVTLTPDAQIVLFTSQTQGENGKGAKTAFFQMTSKSFGPPDRLGASKVEEVWNNIHRLVQNLGIKTDLDLEPPDVFHPRYPVKDGQVKLNEAFVPGNFYLKAEPSADGTSISIVDGSNPKNVRQIVSIPTTVDAATTLNNIRNMIESHAYWKSQGGLAPTSKWIGKDGFRPPAVMPMEGQSPVAKTLPPQAPVVPQEKFHIVKAIDIPVEGGLTDQQAQDLVHGKTITFGTYGRMRLLPLDGSSNHMIEITYETKKIIHTWAVTLFAADHRSSKEELAWKAKVVGGQIVAFTELFQQGDNLRITDQFSKTKDFIKNPSSWDKWSAAVKEAIKTQDKTFPFHYTGWVKDPTKPMEGMSIEVHLRKPAVVIGDFVNAAQIMDVTVKLGQTNLRFTTYTAAPDGTTQKGEPAEVAIALEQTLNQLFGSAVWGAAHAGAKK